MAWRAGNIRTAGTVAKVNLALAGLPRFTAAGDDGERLLRGRILLAPGIDALERAFDASKYGRMSEHPMLEATIPSLVDPSLVEGAQLGRRKGPAHVMSVVAQWMPFTLRDGDWDTDREALGDLVVRELETVAPGIGKQIVARQVHHAARPRARLRPDRRPSVPRRVRARSVLPVAAAPRPRPIPDAARRALPRRLGRPPGRRDHRRARRQRRARDPLGRQAPPLAVDDLFRIVARTRRRLRRSAGPMSRS